MAKLQQLFRGKPDVVLVSFSVFPAHDSPDVLKQYAADHGADPEQWLFLTGDKRIIYELIQKSFFQPVIENEHKKPGYEVDHSFRLMLVDREGYIRGYVDGKEESEVLRLAERIRQLVRAKYFMPPINAMLNGLCAILLVLGYVAIRGRRETLHKVCMLSALAVSACFLAGYVYFHFVILDGQPTRFQGQGWIRPAYFALLLSHTVLAAIVAPLALITAVFGLRDRRPRHVRLARWTLPVWLYVSVTGVVVYWMLYHLYPPW